MLNREIKVDIVKKNPDGTTNITPDISFEQKAAIVEEIIDETVQTIVKGIVVFVILDTLRKVVIERTKNHE